MLNLMTAKSHAFPLNLAGVKKIPLSLVADNSMCTDDLSTTDTGNDDCSWYHSHASSCGNFDSDVFTASSQCCACGGGAQAPPEPTVAACEHTSNGALDRGGDDCDWYDDRFGSCGSYDDDDFTASVHCCGCGGGQTVTVPVSEAVCEDTDGEARDGGNDSCSWYVMYPDSCGAYDDEDFTASSMCCACNGGSTSTTALDESALEDVAEVIAHPEPVVEQVEYYTDHGHPYRPLRDVLEALDTLGEDPHGYVERAREGLVAELRRGVEEADQALTEAKRELLRELTGPYLLLSAESDAAHAEMDAMLASLGGGLNLEADEAPLTAPEWTIDVDHAAGEQMAAEIQAEAEEWNDRAGRIWADWQRDREVVDRYYWRYEMEPHLQEGSRLDERTMRRIATFIAEGTQVKGRPLVEVFPEVEELMMSRYNASEPTLLEKFGAFQLLQETEEWPFADWYEYQECVISYEGSVEAARTSCDWLDTYDNAFESCVADYDCTKYDAFMLRHPTGRVEEETPQDVLEEIVAVEEAIAAEVDPRGGAVVYSLYFDEGRVNAWLDNQALQFTSIQRMLEHEVEDYMAAVDAVNREHSDRFAQIGDDFRSAAESTVFTVEQWFMENASVEPVATTSLAARIESRRQPKVSSSEIFMYASVAIASIVAVVIQVQQQRRKDEREVADVYQKLV